MSLIDLIYETAKKNKCSFEEVIEEEVYGHNIRSEILTDILKKYKR
tara:strand:- start:14033 stop:14170 length:138 start_codon:yes stop_codon:yes gene_type:complete